MNKVLFPFLLFLLALQARALAGTVCWDTPLPTGISITGSSYDITAIGLLTSDNILPSGGGYVEFELLNTPTDHIYWIGLAEGTPSSGWDWQDMSYAIGVNGSGTPTKHAYVNGAWKAGFSSVDSGDVLRIEIVGGNVVFSMNGTPFHTEAASHSGNITVLSYFTLLSGTPYTADLSVNSSSTCGAGPALSVLATGHDASAGLSDGYAVANVSGGTAPYDYEWSSGPSTSGTYSALDTLDGLAPGTYTVTVTDANSQTATATATVGEASSGGGTAGVTWTHLGGSNTTVSGTNYQDAWPNEAILGCNKLLPGHSGSISFKLLDSPVGTTVRIGLAPWDNTIYLWDQTAYSIEISGNTTSFYEGSSWQHGIWSGIDEPDEFEIEVDAGAGEVYFKRNGTIEKTISSTPTDTLFAFALFVATPSGGAELDIRANFDCNGNPVGSDPGDPITVAYSKQDESPFGKGSIQLDVDGGSSPYTYLWSNSETTVAIDDLDAGTYDVTVTDANGQTATASIEVEYKDTYDVVWLDIPAGVTAGDASYRKPYEDPDETLVGCNLLAADTDGSVEFELGAGLGHEEWFYVGLVDDATENVTHTDQVDYLIRVLNDTARVYEHGTVKPSQVATGAEGDRFGVERRGAKVYYSLNGMAFDSTAIGEDTLLELRPVMFLLRNGPGGVLQVDVEADFGCPDLRARYLTEDAEYPATGGSINLIPEGGSPPYTFEWSSGQTLEDLGGVPEGEYQVTVTDALAQTATSTIDLFRMVDAVWRPLPDGIYIRDGHTYYTTSDTSSIPQETLLGCPEFSPDSTVKLSFTVLDTIRALDQISIGFRDTSKAGPSDDGYGFYGFRLTAFLFGMQMLENVNSYSASSPGIMAYDMDPNKYVGFEYAIVIKGREAIYYKNQKELLRTSVPSGIDLMRADAYILSTSPEHGLNLDIRTSIGQGGLATCGQDGCSAYLPEGVTPGTATTLFPGDLTFAGFVDGGPYEPDSVSINANVDILPGTSFSVAVAVYEAGNAAYEETGLWYSGYGLDSSDIASQRITYTGTATIPSGTAISFVLPTVGSGDGLLAGGFALDGTPNSDFCVANNGNTLDPLLEISDTLATAVFLLQGEWHFAPGHGTFNGQVLAGMQTVSPWFGLDDYVVPNSRISRFHPDIECFSKEVSSPLLAKSGGKDGQQVANAQGSGKGASPMPVPEGTVTAFPNPFERGFTVRLEMENDDAVSVELLSVTGQEVVPPRNVPLKAGVNDIPMAPEGHISSGVYLLRLRFREGTTVLRLVKG